MIKISKELEWLRPYYELAVKIIPKLKKLKSITRSPVQRGKISRQLGAMTVHENGYFTITLYTQYRRVDRLKPKPRCMIKKLSKIDILETFSHELAHSVHWEHTPQHKILEDSLCIMFMSKLLEDGYTSEEDELKNERGSMERDVKFK
jgi:hypothetical protein